MHKYATRDAFQIPTIPDSPAISFFLAYPKYWIPESVFGLPNGREYVCPHNTYLVFVMKKGRRRLFFFNRKSSRDSILRPLSPAPINSSENEPSSADKFRLLIKIELFILIFHDLFDSFAGRFRLNHSSTSLCDFFVHIID